ncbi:hypothetical protein Pst134EA_011741 [Puccinia striiformis f. sp. tritici]|uniref:Uncharacterized protein n=1 Tax=Puccinia striiformis f. sp. tritici PST-78 TaxID=1165861 RepID=A0A0L0VUZ8_9BASI|nr:hypothetical protein Pst134EA_011741 [Puccinia striiformis f. sp. tritici]KAH9468120.1 hypothetical protein Pst134EA_011741 [Puccinia striiformis f. sp. tritici]KNF03124.1 hypothetical protein PSTG_03709 [Puccinia striiformis f. sp. tritici PST-78]
MAAFVPATIEEWAFLRESIKQTAILTRSPTQTIELRICAILTFMSGLLYATSFFKRLSTGAWILKADSEGYWHPNVHTTLPIFAVLYVILDVSAVIFVEINLGQPIDPVPVALQLAAYQSLQVFAWLKIWAVLYALLFSQKRSPVNVVRLTSARRLVSPQIFNAFNSLVIITAMFGHLPLIYLLCSAIQKIRHQVSVTDSSFQLVIDVSPNDDSTAIYDAALQTFDNMGLMKKQADHANVLFKIYTIVVMIWMGFNVLAYLISTSFLLRALRSQKNFLISALENRRALKLIQQQEQQDLDSRHSITSWMIESAPSTPTSPNHEASKSKIGHKSFNPWTWRSWIDFANDESLDGHVFWNRIHQLNVPLQAPNSPFSDAFQADEKNNPGFVSPNDAALEKHCTTLIRYWYSTLGQTIIGLGMFTSYLVMAGWLLSRWAHSTGQDELTQAFVWSNWTYGGGPGLLLGIVACVVAFSPTPNLPSDDQPEKPASVKANLPEKNGSQVTLGITRAKSRKDGTLENTSFSVDRTPNSKCKVGKIPALVLKASNHRDGLSITPSDLTRPSNDFIRTENNKSGLDRQPSNSSTYSTNSNATVHHEFLRKNSSDKTDWLKLDNFQSEDLVEEEWVGGHFKAIQRLREGLRGDTRASRASQRAKSRIV